VGAADFAVVPVEVAEFFKIAGRWIVEDGGFKHADALAAGEGLERLAEQIGIRQRLGKQVDERAQRAQKQHNKKPIGIRPTPDEMDNGQYLEDEAPGEKQVSNITHIL